ENSARPPHPLALALIDRLRAHAAPAVLEIGPGSGRNTRALEAAGFRVLTLDDDAVATAALSTHALLHGTPASIAALLERVHSRLEADAPFFVTFGSIRDARYGAGTTIEPHVFAPADGDEAGVAHCYFDEARLRRLLARAWSIESLEETNVDAIAGSWAHAQKPLERAVHWFAKLRRRGQ
ncbi:MAG TPA: hypothetical protein VFN49_12840, partial [Candidatus Aquilonibacter sp.]|nr:hypothetical protein [Candidatus Aquilonibacter sp.]